ncbi:MAG TPA: biotin/lipoyl-binding protein, partial [Aquabacterium sp.]|nr:biotin/lipoyl-binding protein [Aquabacterium sp.]
MSTSPSIWRARGAQVALSLAVVATVGGVIAWNRLKPQGLPEGIASGNGRLEATDIDIATRSGGRVKEVLVQEGAWVQAGQVVATMDTESLQADVARAQAQVTQARHASQTAAAVLKQREQSVLTAQSQVSQRLAEQAFTAKEALRSRVLVCKWFL